MATEIGDIDDTGEFPLLPSAIETLLLHARTPRPQVELAGMSHAGLVRKRNEDTYLLLEGSRGLRVLGTNLPESAMPPHYGEACYGMLVADGMGGVAGGDAASRLAAQTLIALVLTTPDWVMLPGTQEDRRVIDRLIERYRKVDSAVREEAMANPRLTGMGTTLTVAYSVGTHLFVGHVGDSRAYLMRGNKLHQLTRDHTMAQALADEELISAHEVASHHFRHVLTRFIGAGRPVAADVQQLTLKDGDQVLVCTDGLTEMVPEAAVATTLEVAPSAQEACQILIDAALKQGGKDNVSVAVSRYRFPKVG
jgi:protein phosphatase